MNAAEKRAAAKALASAALFGAAGPASKILLNDLSPWELAGLLYLGAAIGAAPIALRSRIRPARWDRRSAAQLFGIVLFGGAIGPVLLLFGLRQAEAGSVSILLNLELMATALLGTAIFGEALGRRGWIGVLAVVGAGVLVSIEGGVPAAFAALLVVGACLCWGLDNQLTSLIAGLSPSATTFWKGAVAGLTNLGIGMVLGTGGLAWNIVLAGLLVGALSYGLSIVLYIQSARELGATRAQGVFSTAPFFGAAIALIALGEDWGPIRWMALAAAAVGVWLLLADSHAHEHVHEALEHEHEHSHDDGHHLHEHSDFPPHTGHSHRHRHEPGVHSHRHLSDLHHRHSHGE